jgi:hypothetical protein
MIIILSKNSFQTDLHRKEAVMKIQSLEAALQKPQASDGGGFEMADRLR